VFGFDSAADEASTAQAAPVMATAPPGAPASGSGATGGGSSGSLLDLFGHMTDPADETKDAATAKAGSAMANSDNGLLGTVGDFVHGVSQEGVGGLLDMDGMMDRQKAQHELSNRFQVVGDDMIGPKRPNQVTEEEYEQIAKTYSDVRLGRGDLTMDTSEMKDPYQAERYRDGTMTAIADMMMTPGGRAQIEHMSDNVPTDDAGNSVVDKQGDEVHRHTTIRAKYQDTNGDMKYLNDGTRESNYDLSDPETAPTGFRGDPKLNPEGSPSRGDDGARGDGCDATIWWTPGTKAGELDRNDVELAHEMEHAFHITGGTNAEGTYELPTSRPPTPDEIADKDAGVANMERQAVGLPYRGRNSKDPVGLTENEYRKERNELGLDPELAIRDHYSGTPPGYVHK
jgi:hypothetical protein